MKRFKARFKNARLNKQVKCAQETPKPTWLDSINDTFSSDLTHDVITHKKISISFKTKLNIIVLKCITWLWNEIESFLVPKQKKIVHTITYSLILKKKLKIAYHTIER